LFANQALGVCSVRFIVDWPDPPGERPHRGPDDSSYHNDQELNHFAAPSCAAIILFANARTFSREAASLATAQGLPSREHSEPARLVRDPPNSNNNQIAHARKTWRRRIPTPKR